MRNHFLLFSALPDSGARVIIKAWNELWNAFVHGACCLQWLFISDFCGYTACLVKLISKNARAKANNWLEYVMIH